MHNVHVKGARRVDRFKRNRVLEHIQDYTIVRDTGQFVVLRNPETFIAARMLQADAHTALYEDVARRAKQHKVG